MTNSKNTKRTLIASAVSVMICMAMLIGTTFAWFTDTASTAVNKIQSGNLDIALEMEKDGKWVSAEGKTLDFKKATGAEDEEILWEPGCTYELLKLRVVNKGNLALKYKISISGIKGDAKLNEVIDWTIGDVALGEEQHLVAGASNEFTISGHMQETAGNDYMNLTIENIAITVVATQDTVESDSFDNQYDKDAQYPVSSQDELSAAVADGKKDLSLGTGVYTLYNVNSAQTKNTALKITGNGANKTTFTVGKSVTSSSNEGNADYSYEGSDVAFKDMTIKMSTANYMGFVRANSLTFENCTFEGMGSYWGNGKVVFKNCTFASNGNYNLWAYSGNDFTFDKCTFNSSIGKFINAYKEQKVDTKLTFNECKFECSVALKPAVCLKSYCNVIWNVSFANCTSNGKTDSTTESNLYSIESGMNAATTVSVDGTTVWENGAKK